MKKVVFFLIALLANNYLIAQINEQLSSTVYEFLYRQAQKGNIIYKDFVLPLERVDIKHLLKNLNESKNKLSKIERKELDFYLSEYLFDSIELQDSSKLLSEKPIFIKKDKNQRFRPFIVNSKDIKIFADPIFGGTYSKFQSNHNITRFSGVRISGYLGKNIGFNITTNDILETGDSLNRNKSFTPEMGIINTARETTQLNYNQTNFNIGYRWKNGSITVGKDNFLLGYGTNSRIILSSKAPSFPYIKFDYHPTKWLHFNYFHGWLNSNILDSNEMYATGNNLYGGTREIFRSKFFANHSITITPTKKWAFTIGESMVYSDKLDFGYLIPINIFKAYDQYASNYRINAGANSQFFFQISSRNHIPNTHIYATMLIDEIRLSKVFDNQLARNQLGYTLGFNTTDFFVHYLSVGGEYTRINPFVYNNLIPTQTYAHVNYGLGDWMGSNADRLNLYVQYTPLPRLRLKSWFMKIRKGSEGSVRDQYLAVPQPNFLFEKQFETTNIGVSAHYEIINAAKLFFIFENQKTKYTNNHLVNNSRVQMGMSFGL